MSNIQVVTTKVAMAFAIEEGCDIDEVVRDELGGLLSADVSNPRRSLLDYEAGRHHQVEVGLQVERYKRGDAQLANLLANPAVAIIKHIVEAREFEAQELLACWLTGDYDAIRREWPEMPESVFEGLESDEQREASIAKAREYHAKYPRQT